MWLNKTTLFLIACWLCSATLFSNNLLAEVYKWKDPSGKIHFSDKAQSRSAEEVIFQLSISEEKVESARKKSRAFVDRQQRKTDFENEENAKTANKVHKEALSVAKKANDCGKAKRELRILKMELPVYRSDKAGKRVYLKEPQRAAEIKQWNKNISRYCR